MKDLFILVVHLVVTIVKLSRKGGLRSVAAESLAIKQQLLVMKRGLQRAPNLKFRERFVLGLCSLFVSPNRWVKMAVILKPTTLLRFHQALVQRKYQLLYSAKQRRRPGPKGPSSEIIAVVLDLKRHNPRFGCLKIAQTISHAFGIDLDRDTVRRILTKHHYPDPFDTGPSWLSFLAHAKDSLWSVDLFKCESIRLQSVWVLVVMDVFTRRLIGFDVSRGDPDGPSVCRMFNHAIAGQPLPKYLSTNRDPLFRFHRWLANLRVLEINEIKAVPYTPVSHPFVERVIGTIRQEFLDRLFFWNENDLKRKLETFRTYYNQSRVHSGIGGIPPNEQARSLKQYKLSLINYRWMPHCQGLFHTFAAA